MVVPPCNVAGSLAFEEFCKTIPVGMEEVTKFSENCRIPSLKLKV